MSCASGSLECSYDEKITIIRIGVVCNLLAVEISYRNFF